MDDETFGESSGQAELQRAGDGNSAMMMMGAVEGAEGINDNLPEFFNIKGTSGDQEFSRCVCVGHLNSAFILREGVRSQAMHHSAARHHLVRDGGQD